MLMKHPYQLFGLSKQMVNDTGQNGGGRSYRVEEPVCLYGIPVKLI